MGGGNRSGPVEVAATLTAKGQRIDFEVETFIAGPAHTLRGEGFDASEDGTGRGTPLVPVAFDARQSDGQIVGALAAEPGMKQTTYIQQGWAVRRLTPTECARLQGFPDHHSRIPWRGKPAELCPDGPQYKTYGNSMAVPVMSWIGERIARNMPAANGNAPAKEAA